MKNYIRKHLKDEKRIIKLMYQKGIFEILGLKFTDLSWEFNRQGKMQRKRGKKYAWRDYLPELHYWWSDYYGEYDSRSVVWSFKDYLFFELGTGINEETGWPIGSNFFTNSELIEHLNKLPLKIKDSKINAILKVNYDNQ